MKLFKQNVLPFSGILVGYLFALTFGAILPGVAAFVQDRIDSYLIFGFMAVIVVFVSTDYSWLYVKAPRYIELGPEKIIIVTAFDNRIKIPFLNIFSIQGFLGSKHTVKVCYRNDKTENYFFLHIDMLKSVETGNLAIGLLLEFILENAENLRRLEVDSFINLKFQGKSGWAKEPEWRIINKAKTTVELNKKIL